MSLRGDTFRSERDIVVRVRLRHRVRDSDRVRSYHSQPEVEEARRATFLREGKSGRNRSPSPLLVGFGREKRRSKE